MLFSTTVPWGVRRVRKHTGKAVSSCWHTTAHSKMQQLDLSLLAGCCQQWQLAQERWQLSPPPRAHLHLVVQLLTQHAVELLGAQRGRAAAQCEQPPTAASSAVGCASTSVGQDTAPAPRSPAHSKDTKVAPSAPAHNAGRMCDASTPPLPLTHGTEAPPRAPAHRAGRMRRMCSSQMTL